MTGAGAAIRPLESYGFNGYIHATKLPTTRWQCSHCGRFVSSEAMSCNGCGADLRGPMK